MIFFEEKFFRDLEYKNHNCKIENTLREIIFARNFFSKNQFNFFLRRNLTHIQYSVIYNGYEVSLTHQNYISIQNFVIG